MGPKLVSSATLQTPLITSLPQNDEQAELKAVSKIIELLRTRKNPVIVVDGGKILSSLVVWSVLNTVVILGAVRNNVIEQSSALIKLLDLPYFITSMSKGGISERLNSKFGGVYGGHASTEGPRLAVENAGVALFIGYYPVCIALPYRPQNLILITLGI